MKKAEQTKFVRDLVKSVEASIVDAIRAGKTPESWDGHELRQYIADKFAEQTTSLATSRKREYRNTVLVNNL